MSNTAPYEMEITVRESGPATVLPGTNSQKYAFTNPNVFTLNHYMENEQICSSGFQNSVYQNLCKPYPGDRPNYLAGVVLIVP